MSAKSGDFFNSSGAAANWTRPTESPVAQKEVHFDVTSHSTDIHIDLSNFEDPKFENSKYVLTSPRSLDACSRLGIKPVELLHKPLLEYQEELLPHGYTMESVYDLYDEEERERQNILHLCREMRDKVIEEDAQLATPYVSPTITMPPSQSPKPITLTKKSSLNEQLPSSGEDSGVEEIEDSGSEESHEADDLSSLQRRRTAWATSIGYDRVTQEELDLRAREINEKGKRQIEQQLRLSKKSGKRGKKRDKWQHRKSPETNDDASSVVSSKSPFTRDLLADAKPIADPTLRRKLKDSGVAVVKLRDQKILERMLAKREEEKKRNEQREAARYAWEEEKQREAAARLATENQRRRQLVQHHRRDERQRPKSYSEYGSVNPEKAGSVRESRHREHKQTHRRCQRDHEKDASARQQVTSTERTVTDRSSSRDSDQNTEITDGHVRRSSTKRDDKDKSSVRGYRNHNGDVTNDKPARRSSRDQKAAIENRRKKLADADRDGREKEIKYCEKTWDSSAKKQQDRKQKELQEKMRQSLERKKLVEKRLERQQKEWEEFKSLSKQKQQNELRRAQSMKECRAQDQVLKAKMKNYQTQKKHQERMDEIKRQSSDNLSHMRSTIDTKLKSAEENYRSVQEKKNEELKKCQRDLERKMWKTRRRQKETEEDLRKWHDDLLQYRKLQEQRAEETAKDQIAHRRKKSHETRVQKERMQKENMKKLLEQEDEWKTSVEANMAMKDAKMRVLQMEKEEIIHESRALAQASQRLREELRHHYSMNDLDQLNQQAELEARIRDPVQTTSSRMSKMTLIG